MEERKKQASNIDQAGNVLYLDQERLDRKEVGFPPYQNKPNGLGIFNWLVEHVLYMNDKRWPLALKLYHMFVRFSVWMKEGGWKARLYKTGIKLYPDMERQTSTLVMPLNVDVTDQGEKVVVPLDLIKESLKNVTYIAGMDTCLCREANQCKDYPMDVACLFLGEPAKTVVKHGLGRFFTYEEACARVDEAARHGLMGQAVWIEVEQILWGVRNDEMDRFLEICFCCPCCCIAMRLARNATPAERHRFHPSGWTAVPDRTKCIGCGACSEGPHGCPVEAISYDHGGKVVIDQELCVGCGICKSRCEVGVIQIKQTMPMRKDLHEYFLKDYNLDIKVWEEDHG
ncbi:MAG: 4Fe-4S binding protein [Ruminiclostridium sp.]|nr:4Fe-4S binding protein [Ruminiclostridium sp.]MBQ9933765.1 4Fe-4S binding protein [Ruminiclostridium sp.]